MFAFEDLTSFTFMSILHLILIYDFREQDASKIFSLSASFLL